MQETLLPSIFAWCCPKSAQSSQSWPICHPCNRICGPTIRTLKSWERIPMKTLSGHSPGSTRRSEAVMLATTLRTLSRRTLYSRTLSGRTFSSGTFLQLGPRARHRCGQVTDAVKSSCWQTTPACLQQDLPPTGHSPSSTRRSEAVMLATAIRTLPDTLQAPRALPGHLQPGSPLSWPVTGGCSQDAITVNCAPAGQIAGAI